MTPTQRETLHQAAMARANALREEAIDAYWRAAKRWLVARVSQGGRSLARWARDPIAR